MRLAPLALLLALLAAPAFADDATEIAFWNSVRDSGSVAELQAYIEAYPQGRFAALARLRLKELGAAASPTPTGPSTHSADVEPPQQTAAPVPGATIRAVDPSYRAIDRVGVEVDASALARGSNWRVVVVPKATGDAVADPDAFASISEAADPAFDRLTLHPAIPGDDEVRLYYIPASGTQFVLAARAPVTIGPAQAGATVFSDLDDAAAALGPLGFEAKYRGRPVLVEGAYSHLVTETTGPDWDALLAGRPDVPLRFVALYVGEGGRPASDTPDELLCLMPAENDAAVRRLAGLQPGDDIVLTGEASIWNGSQMVLNPCSFGN